MMISRKTNSPTTTCSMTTLDLVIWCKKLGSQAPTSTTWPTILTESAKCSHDVTDLTALIRRIRLQGAVILSLIMGWRLERAHFNHLVPRLFCTMLEKGEKTRCLQAVVWSRPQGARLLVQTAKCVFSAETTVKAKTSMHLMYWKVSMERQRARF